MKQKDDPKIKIIQWFLDFLSDDLDAMPKLDFDKRVIEAKYYLGPKKDLESLLYYGDPDIRPGMSFSVWPRDGRLEAIPRFIDDYPWESNLKSVQQTLKSFLEEMMEKDNKLHFVDKIGLLFGMIKGKMQVKYNPPLPLPKASQDPSYLAQAAKLSLSLALDGIPRDAIGVCKECGRYFLHLSKRPKYFCSSKCTVRAISRRRRERDPEAYRASQREIMRRKYREKQAQKRGVPVDRIKIQKRNRKK